MDRLSLGLGNLGKFVVAAVLATTLACAGDEGLIIEVTRLEATPVDSLTFVVATRYTDGTNSAWVKDPDSSVMVPLDSQDIFEEPYRLLLHNGTDLGPDAEVVVAVFGFSNGQEVAFGTLTPPQRFMPGKVLLREILLEGYPDAGTRPYDRANHGCLRWPVELGEAVLIGTTDDKDCDGDPVATDCDDYDQLLGTVLCYGRFPECDFGWRQCTDGVPSEECQQDLTQPSLSVPERFCNAYDQCALNPDPLNPDPFACATGLASMGLECTIAFGPNGICPSAPWPLPVAQTATTCLWTLIDGQSQTYYKVGLSPLASTVTTAELAQCEALFHVLAGQPQPDTVWLGWVTGSIVQPFRVHITPLAGGLDCPAREVAFYCAPVVQ